MSFETVCQLEDITPGTGICGLVKGKQIAIFRPNADEQVFAIDNMDPFAKANVLSRGLIVEHQDQLWVASPIKKQRFNLATGSCMENPQFNLQSYASRVVNGLVEISA